MKAFQLIVAIILLFSAVLFVSCDNQKAGTFAVKFSWAKDDAGKDVKPDVSTGEFFVTVRIYEWKEGVAFPGDIAANGKQLTQSDPAQMKVKGTSIDFGDLSYGSRRFVVAEIRKGEELTGGILFTGMSQLFDFEAGRHTEVNVNMSMTPTPGVDEDGKRIDAELRIVDDNGNLKSYTSGTDLKVKLRLLNAVSFTHVYFANKEENIKTANGKSYKIGELKKIEGVENGYEYDGDWDLSFGLTADEIVVSPELKVYARLENEYGTGLLVMAKIALDNTAPELTLGINPAYTNGSKIITLNISANELIKHDTLNIQTTNSKLLFDCPVPTKNESLSFTCTVETLDATLKDGDYEITVSATDQAGNKSEETKTTLTIDRESPELTFVAYKNGTEVKDTIYLKENDEFKVDLTLSKEPAETPVVRLGSAGIDCEKTADLKYSCTAEIKKETYAEGISDLSVNYQDMAENQFNGIIVSGIRLDYTTPVLNTQIVPGNKSLNASQILQITVNTSEELSSAPTVTLAKNGGGAITLDNTEIQGLSYIYTYPTLVDGTYSFTADAADLAGHNAAQVSITAIISDSSVPTVSGAVTVNPTRIKPSATSTITFTASETMNDPGDTVEIKVGSGTANCTTSNGLNYSCTYTGTAGTEDSIETVIIKLTDASANTSTGSHGTVYVDRTAPDINISLNKTAYNASDTILISVMSSEVLQGGEPVVTVSDFGTLVNPTKISDISWIYEVDVKLFDDDDYTVEASAKDLVGHTGSDTKDFSVVTSIPDLVTGTIDRAKAGLNITYTVDFEITKPVKDGIPVVKANNITLTNCSKNGSDTIFRCTRTVSEETDSTVYAVSSVLEDVAGNKNTVTIGTILVDKTLPAVIAGTANLNIDAGNDCQLPQEKITTLATGSTVYVSVQISELMEDGFIPELRAKKDGAGDIVFDYAYNIGLMYYFEYEHITVTPPESMMGEYELSISLKDEAGNENNPAFTPDKPFKIGRNDPVLVINQNAVSYNRSPWGRSTDTPLKDGVGITKYIIPANDYYEIGPNDIYEATNRLPASTFTIDYGTETSVPVKLKAWDKDKTELKMSNNSPNPDGSFSRGRIWSYNSSEVFVSAIDSGCRETTAVKVENINWVATMNNKEPGDDYKNPHEFLSKGSLEPFLRQGLDGVHEPLNGGISMQTQMGLGSWILWNNNNEKPSVRNGHGLAYDKVRGKIVLFGGSYGGDETWEWEGTNWTLLSPANKPSARSHHAMTYDSARGRVVLFGGTFGSVMNDETWEWDGTNWTQMNPVTKPSKRYYSAMVYDGVRGKVVLFGGYNGSVDNDETWEWDGTNWTQMNPVTKPTARYSHAIAYNSARGKVFLFGGRTYSSLYNNETWEWDGTNWTQMNPANKPSARSSSTMAYFSACGKIILFGGLNGSVRNDETWEWDGTNWTQMNPVNKPLARSHHAMTYDSARGKLILFGGLIYPGSDNETWEWDSTNWTQIKSKSITEQSARSFHAMVYDGVRERVVLFGGTTNPGSNDDTREWDGTNWTLKNPTTKPSKRTHHAMAYDSVRGKIVLFGGKDAFKTCSGGTSIYCQDTWEWDGTNWTQINPATKPSMREGHSMAYDSFREKILLFGGYNGSTSNNETWEWDGVNWTQMTPNTQPSRRYSHKMVYDNSRKKAVMFGGYDSTHACSGTSSAYCQDTWEWDGTNWTQMIPINKPPARSNHAMTYNSAIGKTVLFGGMDGSDKNDTWKWDGNNWTKMNPPTKPSERNGHDMVYDDIREEIVLFGGSSSGWNNETWMWNGGTTEHAGQIFYISWKSSGVTDDSTVTYQSLSVFFNAGGLGDFTGTLHEGVDLLTWKHDRWVTVASNEAGPDALEPVTWETTDPIEIQTLLNSGLRKFNFAVVPTAPNGFLTDMGKIATDYAEVIVRYHIE